MLHNDDIFGTPQAALTRARKEYAKLMSQDGDRLENYLVTTYVINIKNDLRHSQGIEHSSEAPQPDRIDYSVLEPGSGKTSFMVREAIAQRVHEADLDKSKTAYAQVLKAKAPGASNVQKVLGGLAAMQVTAELHDGIVKPSDLDAAQTPEAITRDIKINPDRVQRDVDFAGQILETRLAAKKTRGPGGSQGV